MTARATDPATSHLAATYIDGKRPGLRDAFLMALKALGPSTANEIADWCLLNGLTANAESVRKRAKELIDGELIEPAGERACKKTGLKAGTVRLCNDIRLEQGIQKHEGAVASNERPEGASDTRRVGATVGDSQKIQGQRNDGFANKTRSETVQPSETKLSDCEAERVKAVAEFMRHEHGLRFIPDVANEMARFAKLGTWPAGDSNQYIVAIESAALAGLIERSGSNVRRVQPTKQKQVIQKELFGADG